jgi:hypothetical protein
MLCWHCRRCPLLLPPQAFLQDCRRLLLCFPPKRQRQQGALLGL